MFHPATAVIEGEELVVSAQQVADPRAVRYAFTSAAEPNLINKEGLPASSFRTDRW
jgi:sialate O-acetylesterase